MTRRNVAVPFNPAHLPPSTFVVVTTSREECCVFFRYNKGVTVWDAMLIQEKNGDFPDRLNNNGVSFIPWLHEGSSPPPTSGTFASFCELYIIIIRKMVIIINNLIKTQRGGGEMMGETVIVWTIHTTGGLKTTIRHISVTNNNTHLQQLPRPLLLNC